MTAFQNPWQVQEGDFLKLESPSQRIAFLLNYAVLAPSGHNTQPWRFEIASNLVSLFADRSRALPVADPDDRELYISCGAALFHLRLAATHFGYSTEVEMQPNRSQPDLIARVHMKEAASQSPLTGSHEGDDLLFGAITRRHTQRGDLAEAQPCDLLLSQLQRDARLEDAHLRLVNRAFEHGKLANLIYEATASFGRRAEYCEELSSWLRFNRTRKHDGMPGYSHGLGDASSLIMPSVVRNLQLSGAMAQSDRKLALAAPRLVVLWTELDGCQDWIESGQALARVLLRATAHGLQASFFSTVLESPSHRRLTASMLDLFGYPQMTARLGYGPAAKETPRRPFEEVADMSRR